MSADADKQQTNFHKTEISMIVLSKEPIPEEMEIAELVDLEAEGRCAMNVTGESSRKIAAAEMEDELELAGFSAGLFRDATPKPQVEGGDWLEELSDREVAEMVVLAVGEDRIGTGSLRRMLRESGIAAEEAPAHESPEKRS